MTFYGMLHNLAKSFPEEKKVLDQWVFVLDQWVFVLDQWVFVLDHRVFVLDQWVFGLRSSFLGLRFRYIPAQRAKAWFVHVALGIFWGRLPVTVLKSLNDR